MPNLGRFLFFYIRAVSQFLSTIHIFVTRSRLQKERGNFTHEWMDDHSFGVSHDTATWLCHFVFMLSWSQSWFMRNSCINDYSGLNITWYFQVCWISLEIHIFEIWETSIFFELRSSIFIRMILPKYYSLIWSRGDFHDDYSVHLIGRREA